MYGQFDEVRIIKKIYEDYDLPKTCIEFGAYDGITNSNTYYFWNKKGFRSLLIEPDPNLYELLEKNSNQNCTVINDFVSVKNSLNKIIKKYNYKIIVNKNNFYKIELQQNLPTVDFYFATVNKNNDFHDTWEKVVWSKCKPFIKKKWKNTTLNIPNNYETKLINRYGKNWRIPKNNYKGPKPRKKIL
jgi:6-pyruvoyl-tetrahydropterin synthase